MTFVPAPQSFEQFIEILLGKGVTIPPRVAKSRHISHSFLLKGLASGWWKPIDACPNPNLEWDWIEENIDDINVDIVIQYNRAISWPQLEELMSLTYNLGYATGNPIMPFSYILEHPDVDWHLSEIVEREDYTPENEALFSKMIRCRMPAPRRVTYEMAVDGVYGNTDIDIEYDQFSCNPNIPVERIIYDLANNRNKDIWDMTQLCRHPHITPRMIKQERRIKWEWCPLLCPRMSKRALISRYKRYHHIPLAVAAFWANPVITADMFDSIDTPWALYGLARNPNLTWDYIIDHIDLLCCPTSSIFASMLLRDNWTVSEGIAKKREEAATVIQRWYRRVTIFDPTFPRAEKRFRLAMEKMYQ